MKIDARSRRRQTRLFLWKLSGEKVRDLRRTAADADEELPEQRVDGADLVKPHLVDKFLELQRVVRKQVHAPLPIVKADGAGDDLLHLAGVAPADEPVRFHLALALLDGQRVEVLVFAAQPVHGIER